MDLLYKSTKVSKLKSKIPDVSYLTLSTSTQQLMKEHIASLPPGQAVEVIESHLSHLDGQLNTFISSVETNILSDNNLEEEYWGLPEDGVLKISQCSALALLWSVEGVVMVLHCAPTAMWVAARSRDKAGNILKRVRKYCAVLIDFSHQSSEVLLLF